ncbi:MAG: hypothetical protein IJ600_04065 [Lachnospiraceae bacterium]|nr:hypothetical protein [Lachnospiraceae bacterium]
MRLRSYVRGLGIGIAATALILHFSGTGKAAEMTDAQIRERAAELGMVERLTLADNAQAGEEQKPTAPMRPPQEGNELTESTGGADSSTEGTEPEGSTPASGGAEDSTATAEPTAKATATPTAEPTAKATATPTAEPTAKATATPTAEPTAKATATPTAEPTAKATATPTAEPTAKATATPTAEPTAKATATPTAEPTAKATATPTAEPTAKATATPTAGPSAAGGAASERSGYAVNTEDKSITVVSGDSSYTVARRMANAGIVTSAAELDEFLCRHGYDRTICTGTHVIPAGASYDQIGKIITTRRN